MYLRRIATQNGLELFDTHSGSAQPDPRRDISFLRNAVYAKLNNNLLVPTVHIIRNPLDIVQSAYYSHRSTHPINGWQQLSAQREVLTKCSKEEGFHLTLAFLERGEFDSQIPGPLHALRQWDFTDDRITTVRMEDLISDVNQVLGARIVASLGTHIELPASDEFTFEAITGRRNGEIDEGSHFRTGKPGAWRNELPEAVICYVRAHFSNVLELYYPDAL